MADINIQRKSSNAIWWILGIVALVLIVWFVMRGTGEQPMTQAPAQALPSFTASAGVAATLT